MSFQSIPFWSLNKTSVPASTLLDGLVAYYNLSDGTDIIGGYNLTADAGAQFVGSTGSASPKSGSGMAQFSTTATPGSQVLTATTLNAPIKDSSSSGSYTISGWFYMENLLTSGVNHFYLYKGTSQRLISVMYEYNSGTRRFRINIFTGSNYNYYYNTTLTADTWYHLVMRQSTTSIKLYLNNTLIIDQTNANNGNTGGDNFWVGGYPGAAQSLTGYMDEVAVWDRALDTDEITELYNSGAGKFYPFT